ncbi:unnamed protein product [Caenorhabditis auriculariae]|uniref:Uncharacterized protein n=1 Tax=Caenorhabditis auriculariae TaxID=2777116 RepID=A0A8S1H0A1_9PELO|nr:unnamed protein product [Caenorhabditis auriculariae]
MRSLVLLLLLSAFAAASHHHHTVYDPYFDVYFDQICRDSHKNEPVLTHKGLGWRLNRANWWDKYASGPGELTPLLNAQQFPPQPPRAVPMPPPPPPPTQQIWRPNNPQGTQNGIFRGVIFRG